MADESRNDLLDPVVLLAGCGGDSLLLRKMIESFQCRAPQYLADLLGAGERSDDAGFRYAAHRLRGLVSSFSTSVAATVGEMEQSGIDSPQEYQARCAAVATIVAALSNTVSDLSVAHLERRSIT